MKKLLLVATALIALSLLASTVVVAEPTHPNELGLYTNVDGTGATGGFYEQYNEFVLYLVLTKPADTENGEVPYPAIRYFECRLDFSPFGSLIKTGEYLPATSVNLGETSALYSEGYLEYIVGFATDVPVTNESVVLVTLTFLSLNDPGRIEVTLGPTRNYTPPSIPGQMAFGGAWPSDPRVMYSVSGSHDAPVFIINGEEAVATEQMSFGQVKALYR
jgi:hypothetical protein